MTTRTLAAHRIVFADGRSLCPGYVVISSGVVVDYGKLTGERPFTEWLGGTIAVETTPLGQQAYRDGILMTDE